MADSWQPSHTFRLLDLPLELQRNIFVKYFEDPSTLSIRFERPYAKGVLKYKTNHAFLTAPFLVSHRFNEEMTAALAEVDNTVLDLGCWVYHGMLLKQPGSPILDALYRSVNCVRTTDWLNSGSVREIRKLCQNVREIEYANQLHLTSDPGLALATRPLCSVLQGDYDIDIARSTWDKIQRMFKGDHNLPGREITLKLLERSNVRDIWREDSETFNLPGEILVLEVHVHDGRCYVAQKWFGERKCLNGKKTQYIRWPMNGTSAGEELESHKTDLPVFENVDYRVRDIIAEVVPQGSRCGTGRAKAQAEARKRAADYVPRTRQLLN